LIEPKAEESANGLLRAFLEEFEKEKYGFACYLKTIEALSGPSGQVTVSCWLLSTYDLALGEFYMITGKVNIEQQWYSNMLIIT
uniref:Uncharacterized protein n=1 Tax=Romanomermis culicivorax TaxID=13658 RepID=A0A915KWB3_ROMCU